MSKSVNKTILLGNVGKDPEVKSTNGGTLVPRLVSPRANASKTNRAKCRNRLSGTISSLMHGAPRSFAITSRRDRSYTSRERSEPAHGTIRIPARSFTGLKLWWVTSVSCRAAKGLGTAVLKTEPIKGLHEIARDTEKTLRKSAISGSPIVMCPFRVLPSRLCPFIESDYSFFRKQCSKRESWLWRWLFCFDGAWNGALRRP